MFLLKSHSVLFPLHIAPSIVNRRSITIVRSLSISSMKRYPPNRNTNNFRRAIKNTATLDLFLLNKSIYININTHKRKSAYINELSLCPIICAVFKRYFALALTAILRYKYKKVDSLRTEFFHFAYCVKALL